MKRVGLLCILVLLISSAHAQRINFDLESKYMGRNQDYFTQALAQTTLGHGMALHFSGQNRKNWFYQIGWHWTLYQKPDDILSAQLSQRNQDLSFKIQSYRSGSHTLDIGFGYSFKLPQIRLELMPHIGMSQYSLGQMSIRGYEKSRTYYYLNTPEQTIHSTNFGILLRVIYPFKSGYGISGSIDFTGIRGNFVHSSYKEFFNSTYGYARIPGPEESYPDTWTRNYSVRLGIFKQLNSGH